MSALLDLAAKLPESRALPARDARAFMTAIEAERRARKISCETLSRNAGTTMQSLRRYREGVRPPPPVVLRRLARALLAEDARLREQGLIEALAVQMLEHLASAIDGRQARNLAIYLAHTGLGLPQRGLARLYEVSGTRINAVVRRIEERRDDGNRLDQALMALEAKLDQAGAAFIRGAA